MIKECKRVHPAPLTCSVHIETKDSQSLCLCVFHPVKYSSVPLLNSESVGMQYFTHGKNPYFTSVHNTRWPQPYFFHNCAGWVQEYLWTSLPFGGAGRVVLVAPMTRLGADPTSCLKLLWFPVLTVPSSCCMCTEELEQLLLFMYEMAHAFSQLSARALVWRGRNGEIP